MVLCEVLLSEEISVAKRNNASPRSRYLDTSDGSSSEETSQDGRERKESS